MATLKDVTNVNTGVAGKAGEFPKKTMIETTKYLFSAGILSCNHAAVKWTPALSSFGLILRPLCVGDWEKGYGNLLSQLTSVEEIDSAAFNQRLNEMRKENREWIAVLEDPDSGRVVGSATLAVEKKFIHGLALRGRIEDVVVDEEWRGRKLGQILLEILTVLAEDLGCYKVSLECKDNLLAFYAKLGFHKDHGNNFCVKRFVD